MDHWTDMERRWCEALLRAMIPALEEVDLAGFWGRFGEAAPPFLRLGLRSSVWALTWLPVPLMATPRPFPRLSPDERESFLQKAHRSRSYVLRQLVTTLKVTACFACMEDPRCRSV